MDELPASRTGQWQAAGTDLRLFRRQLHAQPCGLEPLVHAGETAWIQLDRPGRYELPGWNGSFHVSASEHGGIAPAQLLRVQVRSREGGERFRLAPLAVARSLKKQFQTRAVPAWQRFGPLLFGADGRLLFVPGLGVDAAVRAHAGEPQLQLEWQPDQAGRASATGRRQTDG
jgi:tRNA(Ile)-lysidine synthase